MLEIVQIFNNKQRRIRFQGVGANFLQELTTIGALGKIALIAVCIHVCNVM